MPEGGRPRPRPAAQRPEILAPRRGDGRRGGLLTQSVRPSARLPVLRARWI